SRNELSDQNDYITGNNSRSCRDCAYLTAVFLIVGAIGTVTYFIDLQETSSNYDHEEHADHSSRRNLSLSKPVKSAAVWILVVIALAATRYMEGCLLGLFSDRAHSIRNSNTQENPMNPLNNV
ncbi:MAG TPA: hypothetical protein DCL40_03875, partial [Coxiellaceae bacterium]|nr:hypothetical protein [Coxiellaceae bacterium]